MNKNKRVIYFTDSYPFGKVILWKEREIKALSKIFDEIIIIPFFCKELSISNSVPNNVKVLTPTFSQTNNFLSFNSIFRILFSIESFFYIKEFFHSRCFYNRYWFKNWLEASFKIYSILRHPYFSYLKSLPNKEDTVLYFFWGNNYAQLIYFFKKVGFRKNIVRFHGFDLYKERTGGYQAYQRSVLINSSLIIPISNDGLKHLQDNHCVNFPYEVLRLGVNDCGNALSSSDNILRIYSCSRLIKLKRVDLIALALKQIKGVNIHWTHIGDGEELEKIKRLTEDFPDNIKVNFLGWVESFKVQLLYIDSPIDIFLNVSETEGVPVSIMEALSAGVPVIATDVGGVSEIINKRNGFLINKDINANDLANIILNFQSLSDSQKSILRKNAKLTFIESCNTDKLTDNLIRKIEQL